MISWQLVCIVALAVLLKVASAQKEKMQKGLGGKMLLLKERADFSYDRTGLSQNRDLHIKIKGQSGKITFSRNSNSGADKNLIGVSFEELGEVNAAFEDIGRTGPSKHYFQAFPTVNFLFSDLQNSSYHDAAVDEIVLAADLPTVGATFMVSILMFKEDANITIDGENTETKKGDIKLNFVIENWSFCSGTETDGSCKHGSTNQVGSYIKFVFSLKSKGTPRQRKEGEKKRMTGGYEFDLGAEGLMILSKKMEVDGVFQNMSAAYPMHDERGGKQRFIFMFPKFVSNATYDPTYSTSIDELIDTVNNDENGAAGVVAMVSLLCATLFLAVTMARM